MDELTRQKEAYKAVRNRIMNAPSVKKRGRVVMRIPEWMVKRTEFDAHLAGWRKFMGSASRRHIARRAADFGVSVDDICGPSRKSDIVHARHIIAYELVNDFGKSTNEAAILLGGRHHTTVLNSIKAVDRMIEMGQYVPKKSCVPF